MKVGPVKVHHLSDRPKSIEGPNREGGWRAARALDPLRVVGGAPSPLALCAGFARSWPGTGRRLAGCGETIRLPVHSRNQEEAVTR